MAQVYEIYDNTEWHQPASIPVVIQEGDGLASTFYMKEQDIAYTVTGARPKTRLFPFFNAFDVAHLITPAGSVLGADIITDAKGEATGSLHIPPFTFTTGSKIFKFQDSPVYSDATGENSTTSGAEAVFVSTRIERTLQDTIDVVTDEHRTVTQDADIATIITINKPVTVVNNVIGGLGDPLAQSFFTYGVTGGCAITKIDIYFASKDTSLPVTLELRELTNGYPGPKLVDPLARVVLAPSQVFTSTNASVPTSFTFFPTVILEENREYCFVLLTNCNSYNVWTSKLGDISVETGMKVFDQPFIGSMYKSENNITWITDPTEDIKFTMYKAEYSTVPIDINMTAKADPVLLHGGSFYTTLNSSSVIIKTNFQHGFRNGDYVGIFAPTGIFRGILGSKLTGDFAITSVLDNYTFTITVDGIATSTGFLNTNGRINEIQVDSGGANYTAPTLSFSGGGGTSAAATATVVGGKITKVTITNNGAGYLSAPNVTISDISGSGASLAVISDAIFTIYPNRITDEYRVGAATYSPPGTKITTTIGTTSAEYSVLTPTTIEQKATYKPTAPSLLISTKNADAYLAGQTPFSLKLTLETANKNTSPIIALTEPPRIQTLGFIINNQTPIEDLTATSGLGKVTGATATPTKLIISSGGSGYVAIPTVTISPPDVPYGIQATAVATLTGGVVTDITITNTGVGYITLPTVKITHSDLTVPTSIAAASCLLTPFNTEVLPFHGTAASRYFTKPISLELVSTGAQIIAMAYSEYESNFDFYIRTSLSSEGKSHVGQNWKRMSCATERNLSTYDGEYLDYKFYLNDLPPFDVYDLKIVLRSTNRTKVPRIRNYRTIILAT